MQKDFVYTKHIVKWIRMYHEQYLSYCKRRQFIAKFPIFKDVALFPQLPPEFGQTCHKDLAKLMSEFDAYTMWLFGLKTKSILNQPLHLKRLILTALKTSIWFPTRSADKKYVIF